MRSRDELVQKLRQQLKWLTRAADGYDRDEASEAIQIALRLRVLLYDPQRANAQSKSLLTHLGLKRTVRLLSTAAPMPSGGTSHPALTVVSISLQPPEFVFKPKLDTAARADLVPVSTWWGEEVIYGMSDVRFDIMRRDIVCWAANKDGGAHVDAELPAEYRFLESGAGWAISLNPDNGPPSTHTFENAHFAAIRQMAYEVLNSPDIQRLSS